MLENIPTSVSVIATGRVAPGPSPVSVPGSGGGGPASVVRARGPPVSVSVVVPASALPAPAVAAVAAGGASHVHAGGGGVRPLGDAEVNTYLLAIHLCIRHGIPGLCGVLNLVKGHECKSSGPSSLSIKDHGYLGDGAKFAELFLNLPLRGVEAEPEHPKAGVCLGRVPGSLVPPPVGHR